MISSKYGMEEGGWLSREGRDVYGVGLWKEIKKEAVVLKELCQFSLGDGRGVRFWEDHWCGFEPLKTTFPNLYIMAGSKGAFVADCWDLEGVAGGWNLRFLGPSMIGNI